MVETILSSPIISEAVLPFILIFTVVFAILQKSAILGKDKKQIDALVGIVFGLITITFARAVGIINQLLPFLAVSVVLILVFLILVAVFHKEDKEFKLDDTFKKIIMWMSFIAVVIAGLVFTGAWDYIVEKFTGADSSSLVTNVVFILIIIGVFLIVWFGGGKDSESKGKDK
ncbi:hypothetical protein J4423_05165 [Candidatus Pacearchaeota archaeon]|nr:hypothetical protein [Candidatus Pacearchaeota archaeon]